MVVSGLLNWIGGDLKSENAYDIPAKYLVDSTTTGTGGFSIGILTLLGAGLGLLGALRRTARVFAVAGGALAIVIAALFIFQLNINIADINDVLNAGGRSGGGASVAALQISDELDLVETLGVGVYLAVAGGVATVGGAVALLRRQPGDTT